MEPQAQRRSPKDSTLLVTEHVVALGAFSVVMTCAAILTLLRNSGPLDFSVFYESGHAFISGTSMYAPFGRGGRFNLNPPSVTALVFAPLSLLPIGWATFLWSGAGVLTVASAVRVIARELGLSARLTWTAAFGLLSLPGSIHAWDTGQVTWLLLLPTTLAWRAYRRHLDLTAGLWLAPLIAAKPFFVLAVLPLGRRVVLTCGLAAGGVTVLAIAATGWQPWAEWLAVSDQIRWLPEPANASVVGALARFKASGPVDSIGLADLGYGARALWVGTVVAMVAGTTAIPRSRSDSRWLAGLSGAIIVAPLGWLYYVPLCASGAIAHLRQTDNGAMFIWAQLLPFVLLTLVVWPPWLYATLGSWYTWALIGLWATIVTDAWRRSAPGRLVRI